MRKSPIAPDSELMLSEEVAQFARVSLRQLQWWDERNILRPKSKAGYRRQYTRRQAAAAMVLGELRQKTGTMGMARKAVRILGAAGELAGKFLCIVGRKRKIVLLKKEHVVAAFIGAKGGSHLVEIVEPSMDQVDQVARARSRGRRA